jgi:hypothetical protein
VFWAINMLGSVVFSWQLADAGAPFLDGLVMAADVSVAGMVANGLTLVVTTSVGWLLGEPTGGAGTALGCALVVAGAAMCLQPR